MKRSTANKASIKKSPPSKKTPKASQNLQPEKCKICGKKITPEQNIEAEKKLLGLYEHADASAGLCMITVFLPLLDDLFFFLDSLPEEVFDIPFFDSDFKKEKQRLLKLASSYCKILRHQKRNKEGALALEKTMSKQTNQADINKLISASGEIMDRLVQEVPSLKRFFT